MSWMLKKGDKIEEGRRIFQGLTHVVPVSEQDVGMYNLWNALWFCADDIPPDRADPSKSLSPHALESCG